MLTRTLKDNRVVLLGIALIVAVLLSACGIKVTSKTTADANFAGERVFTLSIAKKDIEDAAKGSISDFDAAINKHLPGVLTYSGAKESGDNLTATLTMAFSDKDDYIQKIGELAGDAENAQDRISIVTPDTAFLSGFAMDENYTSSELFAWLADALVDEGIVEESNRGNVIATTDLDDYSEFVYDGETYKSETAYRLVIDGLVDHGMGGVLVTTSLLPESYLETYVQFLGTEDSLTSEQLEALKTHLESHMPSGGERLGDDSDTVVLKADSPDQLVSALQELLADDSIALSINTAQSAENRARIETTLNGHVDCEGVCSPQYSYGGSVRWGFVVPAGSESSYGVGETLGSATDLGDQAAYTYDKDFDLAIARTIDVKSIVTETDRSMSGAYTTNITYELPVATSETDADAIDLDAAFDPGDLGSMKREDAAEAIKYVVTIEAADAPSLADKLNAYVPGSYVDEQLVKKGIFRNQYYVTVGIPLANQFGSSPALETVDQSISFPFGYSISKENVTGAIDGRTVTTTLSDGYTPEPSALVKGSTVGQAIGLALLLILLIGAIVLLILFRKQIKQKLDARKQSFAQYQQDQAAMSASAGSGAGAGYAPSANAGAGSASGSPAGAGPDSYSEVATTAALPLAGIAAVAGDQSAQNASPAAASEIENKTFDYDNTLEVDAPRGLATQDGWHPPYTAEPAPPEGWNYPNNFHESEMI